MKTIPARRQLPPAPGPGQPVTVTMDDLSDWLAAHNLEILGSDAHGRIFVAKKDVQKERMAEGEGKV